MKYNNTKNTPRLFLGAIVLSFALFSLSGIAQAQTEQKQIVKEQKPVIKKIIKKPIIKKVSKKTKDPMQNQQVRIITNKGNIEIELFNDKTPKTAENFVSLVNKKFYNDIKFHRVIKGFMIQAGDPLTKDETQKDRWGTGGPGYKFDNEIISGLSNTDGMIAMANSGPNTNGSQFYINVANNANIDGAYTVFGKVTKGLEIVHLISETKTGPRDVPNEPIIIKTIELLK